MPLIPAILEQMFLDVSLHPPQSAQVLAQKLAQAYESYGRTAVAPGAGPVVLTGAERLRMEKILVGGFIPPQSGNPGKASSGIFAAIQMFWLGVPAGIGICTAFLGAPVMGGVLSSMVLGISAPMAAKKLAQAFDAGTRLVQVTMAIPPFTTFLA